MTKNDLRDLIKHFIKEEIDYHKKDMIKEIKAELFDIIMNSKTQDVVNNNIKSENINKKKTTDNTLSKLQDMLNEQWGHETNLNTSNVKLPIMSPNELPNTYDGKPLKEEHIEVMEHINKDYSALMKKLGL